MGAGVKRWWLDSSGHQIECDEWRARTNACLTRAIVVAPRAQLSSLRRAIAAFAELWKVTPE